MKWVWKNLWVYPDTPFNAEGWITYDDLRWIASIFPGDVVNQKRLFALVNYYRPRAIHDFIYIPARIWAREISSHHHYQEFINSLESKGLLRSIKSFKHAPERPDLSFSRKYKLFLPSCTGQAISYDGRNVQGYYEAHLRSGKTIREISALTGVTGQRFYEAKGRLALVIFPEMQTIYNC